MGGCVLEDEPIHTGGGGTGGVGGTSGSGGSSGACGACGGSTPACDEDTGRCVECTATDERACVEDTPRCDVDNHVCVECLDTTDCTSANAARCNTTTKQCVGCQSPADCESVPGAPLCSEGKCVQCTPGDEDEDCGGRTCNPRTSTCTMTEIGSLGTCEACVTDSDCGELDNRCVAMLYQGTRFPDENTGFCLKTTAGLCMQPFSIPLEDGESLSGGETDDYCGINQELATCPAVLALLNNDRCDMGEDDECPQPSGICRQVGFLENRCTYPCSSVVECLEQDPPGRPGSTCGASEQGGENYCGGLP